MCTLWSKIEMFCNFVDTPEIDETDGTAPPPAEEGEAPPEDEEEAERIRREVTQCPTGGCETAEESKVYSVYAKYGRVSKTGNTGGLKDVTIVSNDQCSKPSSRNASEGNYLCGELAEGENSVRFDANDGNACAYDPN